MIFERLSEDVIVNSFKYLEIKDWLNFVSTNKYIYYCKNIDNNLWNNINLSSINTNKVIENIKKIGEINKDNTYIVNIICGNTTYVRIPNNLKKVFLNTNLLILETNSLVYLYPK